MESMPRYYAGGLVRELGTKNVFLLAQAIAFKVLVTIVPIVILVTGLLGNVLRYQEPFSAVSRFVRGFLPAYESEQLLEFLGAFQGASGTFLSVGTVGLILAAMTLATTVRLAVASAFEQDWNEPRSLFGGYAFDLRMVAQVGGLFLLTVALSFLVQALNAEGLQLMQRLGLERALRAGWRSAFDALSLAVPLLVSTAMFFQLFYFIPLPHPPWSSALIGAFVTAVLWEAAKYSFTLYATHVGTFNYQTASDGMAALTGSFALLIAFMLWVYWSGIVLMVGAVITSLHEQRRRMRRRAERAAPFAGSNKLDAAAGPFVVGGFDHISGKQQRGPPRAQRPFVPESSKRCTIRRAPVGTRGAPVVGLAKRRSRHLRAPAFACARPRFFRSSVPSFAAVPAGRPWSAVALSCRYCRSRCCWGWRRNWGRPGPPPPRKTCRCFWSTTAPPSVTWT
ncbi:MAG: hypothetical protein BRD29_02750, partial [Bacteroidetes bacterium QH_2_67_10]